MTRAWLSLASDGPTACRLRPVGACAAQPASTSAAKAAQSRGKVCGLLAREGDRRPGLGIVGTQGGRESSHAERALQLAVQFDNLRFEGNQLIGLERGDRNSIAQENAVRGDGRDPKSRRQDAGKIQGVGATDGDDFRYRCVP